MPLPLLALELLLTLDRLAFLQNAALVIRQRVAKLLLPRAPFAVLPQLQIIQGQFEFRGEPLGRLRGGVEYREEILRHVRQQVAAAAPFDCLCVQHDGVNLARNLTGVVAHYAARVPRDRTVFVAGHRVDLVGLDEFRAVWDSVYTLALYDWNGDGLQGRQFSSVINRLVCREAERVHSWVARVESTRECW